MELQYGTDAHNCMPLHGAAARLARNGRLWRFRWSRVGLAVRTWANRCMIATSAIRRWGVAFLIPETIGLVTFDTENPKTPHFSILVRPARHEPDLFYTNKYMVLIEEELFP